MAIWAFKFDDRNVGHFAPKGLTEDIVWAVWEDEPVAFVNRPGRSATHLLVGSDATGRPWTVAIVCVDDELRLWRPITGWPSTAKEVRAWRDAS